MARTIRTGCAFAALTWLVLSGGSALRAQLKGQYQPGQYGLNAGVLPDPGITYADLNLNYSAGRLISQADNRSRPLVHITSGLSKTSFSMFLSSRFLERSSHPDTLPHTRRGDSHAPIPGQRCHRGTGGLGLADTWFQPLTSAGTCRERMSGPYMRSWRPPAAIHRAPRIISVLVTGAMTFRAPALFI